MKNSRQVLLLILVLLCVTWAEAKQNKKEDKQQSVDLSILWPPNAAAPNMKITFAKIQKLAEYNGQNSLNAEVTVQNLSETPISRASFTVYFYDSQKVRIGQSSLLIEDVKAGASAKYPLQFFCVGLPASLELHASNDANGIPRATKNVPLRVITVPPGATLKVDGQRSEGLTPKLVYLAIGTHTLEVSKEGYATGSTPVEIAGDELPGGSITIEMGGLLRDTVELRDGTILLGDVLSMSLTDVDMRVDGVDKKIERNQVKKMILVEREISVKDVTTPATAK